MGPLVNPVQPEFQNLGTYDVKTARLYHYVMPKFGREIFDFDCVGWL